MAASPRRRRQSLTYARPDTPNRYYDFTVKGRRFRGSCETDDEATAEIVAAKIRSDALLRGLTGRRPTVPLDAALGRYWLEHAQHLASSATIKIQGANLLAIMAKATPLDELVDADVAAFAARRRAKVSNSTVNRELTLLRAVLRMARDRWGYAVAGINWKAHWLREPEGRTRYLTPEEAQRLIAAAAKHIRPAIVLSLATGIRLANCVGLDWSMVDLRNRVITLRVKSRLPGGKVLTVPLSEAALVALANHRPREAGPVFTWRGRAIQRWRRAFRTAMRRAKIQNFRWHDIRHTTASWMVQSGVPLDTVRDTLGHARIETTMRYAHREVTAQRAAVDVIASQIRHTPETAVPKRKRNQRAAGT